MGAAGAPCYLLLGLRGLTLNPDCFFASQTLLAAAGPVALLPFVLQTSRTSEGRAALPTAVFAWFSGVHAARQHHQEWVSLQRTGCKPHLAGRVLQVEGEHRTAQHSMRHAFLCQGPSVVSATSCPSRISTEAHTVHSACNPCAAAMCVCAAGARQLLAL